MRMLSLSLSLSLSRACARALPHSLFLVQADLLEGSEDRRTACVILCPLHLDDGYASALHHTFVSQLPAHQQKGAHACTMRVASSRL